MLFCLTSHFQSQDTFSTTCVQLVYHLYFVVRATRSHLYQKHFSRSCFILLSRFCTTLIWHSLLQDKDRHYDASLKHYLNLWEEALDKLHVAAVHRASTLLTAEHFPQTESIALALEHWKQAFASEWASLQNDHAFNARVSQQEVGPLLMFESCGAEGRLYSPSKQSRNKKKTFSIPLYSCFWSSFSNSLVLFFDF